MKPFNAWLLQRIGTRRVSLAFWDRQNFLCCTQTMHGLVWDPGPLPGVAHRNQSSLRLKPINWSVTSHDHNQGAVDLHFSRHKMLKTKAAWVNVYRIDHDTFEMPICERYDTPFLSLDNDLPPVNFNKERRRSSATRGTRDPEEILRQLKAAKGDLGRTMSFSGEAKRGPRSKYGSSCYVIACPRKFSFGHLYTDFMLPFLSSFVPYLLLEAFFRSPVSFWVVLSFAKELVFSDRRNFPFFRVKVHLIPTFSLNWYCTHFCRIQQFFGDLFWLVTMGCKFLWGYTKWENVNWD